MKTRGIKLEIGDGGRGELKEIAEKGGHFGIR